MKILVAHNRYQVSGGEEVSLELSLKCFESLGHKCIRFEALNETISGILGSVQVAFNMRGGGKHLAALSRVLEDERPDMMLVHNFHPLLSPSIFKVAHKLGIKTVWTVHNFRYACINGLFMRQGKPCEVCVGAKVPFQGIINKCYKNSYLASAAVAWSIDKAYWASDVIPYIDVIIANSSFTRDKMLEAGFSPRQVIKMNNFCEDVALKRGVEQAEIDPYFLFAGRLSEEKGVDIILNAARSVTANIRIAGTGPLEASLRSRAPHNVQFLGKLDRMNLAAEMQGAMATLVPSRFYETFGRIIAESAAFGTPTIGMNHGAIGTLISDYSLGILVDTDDPELWSNAMNNFAKSPPSEQARKKLEQTYEREFSFLAGRRRWSELLAEKFGAESLPTVGA